MISREIATGGTALPRTRASARWRSTDHFLWVYIFSGFPLSSGGSEGKLFNIMTFGKLVPFSYHLSLLLYTKLVCLIGLISANISERCPCQMGPAPKCIFINSFFLSSRVAHHRSRTASFRGHTVRPRRETFRNIPDLGGKVSFLLR